MKDIALITDPYSNHSAEQLLVEIAKFQFHKNKTPSDKKNLGMIALLSFFIFALVVVFRLYHITSPRQITLWILIILQILIFFIWPAVLLLESIRTVLNPFKTFIRGIEKKVNNEVHFIKWLEGYNVLQLGYLADRIEMEYQQLTECGQALIGDINKIGFFPSFFAMAATAFVLYEIYTNSTFLPSITLDIMIVICIGLTGFCIGSLFHAYNIRRAKLFIFLIRQAMNAKRE